MTGELNMTIAVLMALLIIVILAWALHAAWREIDDMSYEIEELRAEACELESLARSERRKVEVLEGRRKA